LVSFLEGYLGGFVALNADVEAVFGVVYANTLEVVVNSGSVNVVSSNSGYAGFGGNGQSYGIAYSKGEGGVRPRTIGG
jgi:hypothetical protein